jgi:subtilisin family serine protease
MHRVSPFLLTLAVGMPLFAQEPVAPAPTGDTQIGIGTEPVPGLVAGTSRYNVTFATRPFDLGGFRTAIESGANAATMERIVADLQGRAIEHQTPFQQAIVAMGGRVVLQFWLINAATIEVKPAQLAAVRALPNVLFVAPDLPTYPLIKTSTNAANHNADAVQAAGITATGFAVAINDTGQDSNMAGINRPHQIYYRNGNTAITTAGGLNGSRLLANVQLGTFSADDTNGHGTGVAGIVAGETWNNAGADRGHASDAFLVGYSICASSPACNSSLSIEASAFQQCATDKVKFNIVSANMSYGSSPDPTDVSQQAIDAAALNASIVCCCAAGNSGPGTSSTTGSSATSNGLAVAACNPTVKTIASFSSRGPLNTDPSRFYPDITGCGVNTVMPARDNETGTFVASGTSMATPQVTGAAALVKAARPASSAREIKAILLASTENISAQNAGLNRNAFGLGFLRDDLAVALAQRPGTVLTSTIASTAVPKTHLIDVSLGQQYSVCLVFFRHVLTSTAFSNLGLRVLNGATVVASSNDPRNLYEKVTFTAPITGTLTVEVSASTLEVNPLPYSLASTATFSGLAPASWANAGAGCPGTKGIPSLFPNANPVLGSTFTVRMAYARASSLGFFLIGFSNTVSSSGPLPLNLVVFGAPNCFLRTDIAASDAIVTDANGTGAMNYGIPNVASLLGAQLYQQAMSFDPPANALGFTASNAGAFVIGEF